MFQHQGGSNKNRISRIRLMSAFQITQPSFLEQVQQLAPSIFQFITAKHARITAAVTSHDVTMGYGRGFTFHLKLELLVEQCLTCFETPFTQSLDCRWHRFEKRFMQVADAEAPTLEKALVKLEAAMFTRERRMAA
jgi:hypothetical protein